MPYWCIKWGHTIRYGEGHDERSACIDAFGMFASEMTWVKFPRSPKYMSNKSKFVLQEQLNILHNEKEKRRAQQEK